MSKRPPPDDSVSALIRSKLSRPTMSRAGIVAAYRQEQPEVSSNPVSAEASSSGSLASMLRGQLQRPSTAPRVGLPSTPGAPAPAMPAPVTAGGRFGFMRPPTSLSSTQSGFERRAASAPYHATPSRWDGIVTRDSSSFSGTPPEASVAPPSSTQGHGVAANVTSRDAVCGGDKAHATAIFGCQQVRREEGERVSYSGTAELGDAAATGGGGHREQEQESLGEHVESDVTASSKDRPIWATLVSLTRAPPPTLPQPRCQPPSAV